MEINWLLLDCSGPVVTYGTNVPGGSIIRTSPSHDSQAMAMVFVPGVALMRLDDGRVEMVPFVVVSGAELSDEETRKLAKT